ALCVEQAIDDVDTVERLTEMQDAPLMVFQHGGQSSVGINTVPQVATNDAETRRVKTARGLEQGVGCHPRRPRPDLCHDPREHRCMTKAQFSSPEPLFGLRK